MTIKDLINWASFQLVEFDSARLDAELLLARTIGKDIAFLMAHDDKKVGFWARFKFKRLVAKRKQGMPVSYLLGHKEFYSLDFLVHPDVLVPRPDTELLVEAVINYIKPSDVLLDVGTGSGCIPISVLRNVPKLEAVAVDISKKALKVAQDNAQYHEVADRIKLFESDLLEDLDVSLFEGKNLVVTANLPYVPEDYQVNVETKFEPQMALYGGEDGLDAYRKLAEQLMQIKPKALFFECYEFQVAQLCEHLPDYELKFAKNALGDATILMLERV